MLMTSCGGYKIRSSMGNFHITVPAAKSSAVKMFRDMRKVGKQQILYLDTFWKFLELSAFFSKFLSEIEKITGFAVVNLLTTSAWFLARLSLQKSQQCGILKSFVFGYSKFIRDYNLMLEVFKTFLTFHFEAERIEAYLHRRALGTYVHSVVCKTTDQSGPGWKSFKSPQGHRGEE